MFAESSVGTNLNRSEYASTLPMIAAVKSNFGSIPTSRIELRRRLYNIEVPLANTRIAAPVLPAIDPQRYTLRQRIVLRIIISLGYSIIRLIGPTLRVAV